jgi:hypothetical protein
MVQLGLHQVWSGEEGHFYPAQIWFFVNLQTPKEICDKYREGVEDIQKEDMRGFNGDGLYAVVSLTDALPVTMVTSNIQQQQEHLQHKRPRRRFEQPVSF